MPLYLVTYDVSDQRRRTRLAKTLLDFGKRVQYSVFECPMSRCLLPTLKSRIEALIDPDEDQVRIYLLCSECADAMTLFGPSVLVRVENVIVI